MLSANILTARRNLYNFDYGTKYSICIKYYVIAQVLCKFLFCLILSNYLCCLTCLYHDEF